MALIEGEGLQQTEVEPGACLAGAELLAQYGKPRLKRTRRLRAQSRNLRMMVWLSALFRGSTTSRNPSPNSRPHCGSCRCGSRNFAPCSWPPRSVAAIAGRARQQRLSICGLIARSHIAGFQFSGIVRFSHGTEFQNCFQGACTRCNLYISIYDLSVSVNKLDSACCFVACSRRPCPPAGILHPARTIFIRFQS